MLACSEIRTVKTVSLLQYFHSAEAPNLSTSSYNMKVCHFEVCLKV